MVLIVDLLVLILLVKSNNNLKNIERKLLKLYEEHSKISVSIMELLNHISLSIDEGNGAKLENYSLIENELIMKLVKIKKIIVSYEKICSVSSNKLDKCRELAVAQQEVIMIHGKKNRNTLKTYLKKISLEIDIFSRKILYSPSFSKQILPQFVDLSI